MKPSPKPALYDLSRSELEALMKEWGQPAFRGRQIYQQLYVQRAGDLQSMTELSKALRDRLSSETTFSRLTLDHVLSGDKGMTRKALFSIESGPPVEAVLMIYEDRATVCVSTQSGCAMNCSFCATGKIGFRLNLTAGQMIEQVLWAARELKAAGGRVDALSNVVYMGMGEPFNNYDAWWTSVERLHDPDGFNLGARSFTVSTVGIIPGIQRLTRENLPINLAVSLHAPNDQLRDQLVPVNRKYPIANLMQCVREYTDQTHRRVSFEYVLIEKLNDQPEHAAQLADWLSGKKDRKGPMLCHVNLIPWNRVPGLPMEPSVRKRALEFQRIIENARVACTIRVQRGVDIAAACGQLAGEKLGRDSSAVTASE